MQQKEKIPVYVRLERGRTVCICHAGRKQCDKPCERDAVMRDKFTGWENTMHRDRYGR